MVPAGFAVRGTLTVPLVTLTQLADRAGVLAGLGPVDPWQARDLATASAANPKTTWCLTVVRHEALLDREEVQDLVLSVVAAAG